MRRNMVDIDMIMTSYESERYNKAILELKEGKTISLDIVKKELGL